MVSGHGFPAMVKYLILFMSLFISTVIIAQSDSVQTMLQHPERELTDKIRDSARKPAQVLEFLGIEPGMKVLELYAGGGYYTVILSAAVGENGIVYAQNSPRVLRYEEDRSETTAGEALDAKLKALAISNVRRIDASFNDIHFLPNSLDAVVVFQVFHDYYNGNSENGSPNRAEQMMAKIKEGLKPGGVVGIIDHVGNPGADNRRFHRMQKKDAIAVVEKAGFVVEADSELLANPKDDHRRSIFDPRLNRDTDRFLLRVRLPGLSQAESSQRQ